MSVELDKIKDLEKQVAYLQGKNAYYEHDGIGKLYHALNRKANEMAELLNKTSLTAIDIDDPKIKTFERLQKIWVDAGTISASIKALEVLAGINQEVTILSVANIIKNYLYVQQELVLHPAPEGSVSRRCPNISLLESKIDYRPAVDLHTGIKQTLDSLL